MSIFPCDCLTWSDVRSEYVADPNCKNCDGNGLAKDPLEESDREVRKLLGSIAGYLAQRNDGGAAERLRQINDWFTRFPSEE